VEKRRLRHEEYNKSLLPPGTAEVVFLLFNSVTVQISDPISQGKRNIPMKTFGCRPFQARLFYYALSLMLDWFVA